MTVLWVTTFSADLFAESGRHLLESFVATKTPGTLMAYVEGMDIPAYPNVVQQHLDNDPFLVSFLRRNKDIIPKTLGGAAPSPECRCGRNRKALGAHDKKHKLPCVGYWFCKNAYRWLRKPLAAKKACDSFGDKFDVMMWVDSDALFLKENPAEVVESWFQNKYGCIYLKSRRTAIETGVFGYHMKHGGRQAADAVLARYSSGAFRRDQRWDDCVQMEKGLTASKVLAADLATDLGPNNTVIQFSPLAEYLGHAKGSHRRTGKLT